MEQTYSIFNPTINKSGALRRTRYLLALAEAAGVALAAALFADHRRLAALRAQVADLQHGLFQRHGRECHLVHLALAELVRVRSGNHPGRGQRRPAGSAPGWGRIPANVRRRCRPAAGRPPAGGRGFHG